MQLTRCKQLMQQISRTLPTAFCSKLWVGYRIVQCLIPYPAGLQGGTQESSVLQVSGKYQESIRKVSGKYQESFRKVSGKRSADLHWAQKLSLAHKTGVKAPTSWQWHNVSYFSASPSSSCCTAIALCPASMLCTIQCNAHPLLHAALHSALHQRTSAIQCNAIQWNSMKFNAM